LLFGPRLLKSCAVGVGIIPTNRLNVTLCIDPSFTWLDFMFAVAPVLSIAVGVGSILIVAITARFIP
jgi:hypothetical protein